MAGQESLLGCEVASIAANHSNCSDPFLLLHNWCLTGCSAQAMLSRNLLLNMTIPKKICSSRTRKVLDAGHMGRKWQQACR
jgi:hypothetical protein